MTLLDGIRGRTPRVDLDVRDAAIIAAPVVAGGAIGALTAGDIRGWYRTLDKPGWNPPDAVFGPVWTTLYLLMGVAAAVVARRGRRRPEERDGEHLYGGAELDHGHRDARADLAREPDVRPPLVAFAVQLLLNLGWSLIFFRARRLRLAFAELVVLWVAIAVTAVAFARVRIVAGLLLVPYLAWTSFAGVLNLDIARRNPRR